MTRLFENRVDAGRVLARRLGRYAKLSDSVIVVGLPRGGVPVAAEVARALDLPLDIQVVRKLGMPAQPELAMGAVAGDVLLLDRALVMARGIDDAVVDAIIARERTEMRRRERLYRHNRAPLNVAGKTVLLIDDGIATGMSIHAAAMALKAHVPTRIVVATPVAASATYAQLEQLDMIDECVCVMRVPDLVAIGMWYRDFLQTNDNEVMAALASCRRPS